MWIGGLKICLQHLKVYRMFPTIQIYLLLSMLVLIHASTDYSMPTKYEILK